MTSLTEYLQQEKKKARIAIRPIVLSTGLSRVDGKHPTLNRLIEVLMNMLDFIIPTMIKEFTALNMFPLLKLKILISFIKSKFKQN